MTRRQGGWARANSHLVTFRKAAAYSADGERLMLLPGTRLVGMLIDGPEPALQLPAMTLALSRDMVEIAPNPDPRLTLRALAEQTEKAAGEALASGDPGEAADRYLEAAVQYRLLDDEAAADRMEVAAQHAHNRSLRTPEGIAPYDRHTAELSDEALRQLGATLRAALRQLGGYQYRPATFTEALAAWEVVRQAVAQVANLDSWNRDHPRPVEPIAPETMWVGPDYLASELLTEPQGSPERLIALAETALALDPDEADGYVLLGGLAASRGDLPAARRWYEVGVRAGERKLGPAYFSGPDRPTFWMAVETRPYMRARAALAGVLHRQGELAQAVAEYWGMLELNPGDNQGLRYTLASLLLEQPDHAGFERLYRFMSEVNDASGEDEGGEDEQPQARQPPADPLDPSALSPYESAYWLYPAALYHFQREGDGERARAARAIAARQNPHVLPLLMGRTVMPRKDPPYYTPGSFDEAVLYAKIGRAAWVKTPGAIEWLRARPAAKAAPKAAAKAPRAEGQPSRSKARQGAAAESLADLLAGWLRDGATVQGAATKKAYRAPIARLLDWLEAQGQPLVPASLTADQVEAFLAAVDPQRRSQARNSIAVWCGWLVRRGALAKNPVARGG